MTSDFSFRPWCEPGVAATLLHPREAKVPNAPGLDLESRDPPLRVALHVDHVAAAREAVLVTRLEHAEAPVVRVDGEMVLFDLPRVRRLHLVAAIVARVLGELRRRDNGRVRAREHHRFPGCADDHARRCRGVALEVQLGPGLGAEAAAVQWNESRAFAAAE